MNKGPRPRMVSTGSFMDVSQEKPFLYNTSSIRINLATLTFSFLASSLSLGRTPSLREDIMGEV